MSHPLEKFVQMFDLTPEERIEHTEKYEHDIKMHCNQLMRHLDISNMPMLINVIAFALTRLGHASGTYSLEDLIDCLRWGWEASHKQGLPPAPEVPETPKN